jgi:hypothetical protein
MAQMGFFDLSDRYVRLDAKKKPLIGINAVVPWGAFRPLLELVWRKPVDVVLMFKTLVPSARYNLSDDQIEYQVRDRLSFMRFLGLGPWGWALGTGVPDAKTVWLQRYALAKAAWSMNFSRSSTGIRRGRGVSCSLCIWAGPCGFQRWSRIEALLEHDSELIAGSKPFSDIPPPFFEVADGQIDQFGGGLFGRE